MKLWAVVIHGFTCMTTPKLEDQEYNKSYQTAGKSVPKTEQNWQKV